MGGGRFGPWGQIELPGGCFTLWPPQRRLWHLRDTRFMVLLLHTPSRAIQTGTVWNSLSLGLGGQRETRVPSVGSGEPSAETEKEPKQPRTENRRIGRSSYFWHCPWSWGPQTSGHGEAPLGPPGSPSHLVALWGGSCRHFPSLDDVLSTPNKYNNLR